MHRFLLISGLLLFFNANAQDNSFLNDNFYTWPDNNKIFEIIPDSLKNDDAVILKDDLDINFPDRFVKRRQAIKILNLKGLNYFTTITLPQNFDITTLNNPVNKQGRFSNRIIPFVDEFKISYFAARIIRNKTIILLPLKLSTNKVQWVKNNGERVYDYEYLFSFDGLEVNDILEYSYKANIKGSYGTNQFYANDYFPKLKTNITIKTAAPSEINNTDLLINTKIDSSIYTRKNVAGSKYYYQEHFYKFNHLKGIKYTQNSIAGQNLAHISADASVYKKHYYNETIDNAKFFYTTKYGWYIIPDSLKFKVKIYDKIGSSMRKFVASYDDHPTDTNKTQFFGQVYDAMNSFKYLSAEKLFYGTESQYLISSADRLLKHELAEEFLQNAYSNILFEKDVFYYIANVQDRRFGNHSFEKRSHESYETEFIALPVNKYYKFYMPRFAGLKYLPDELPFYLEGSNCVLIPKNTQATKYYVGINDLKFTKTPLSKYTENVRIENAILKVDVDSLLIKALIKENLNGQFSTILRHYYNNEYIDSTILPQYFRTCLQKPHSSNQSIKLLSQSKTFPFRASYSCNEKIALRKDTIDLTNWFSFLFTKEQINSKYAQDYELDFTYTDTYNFLFEFTKPVNIANESVFNKTLMNDFFEINSALIKQDGNKYLLSVTTKAKQYSIPESKFHILTDYISALSDLNSLKLILTN